MKCNEYGYTFVVLNYNLDKYGLLISCSSFCNSNYICFIFSFGRVEVRNLMLDGVLIRELSPTFSAK